MHSLYDVTVAVPAHPARLRNGMLDRALYSVTQQKRIPAAVSVAVDIQGNGAPATRQRALDAVATPWVAFLDSDDEFLPEHLDRLMATAIDTGADYVYSWFHGSNGFDPFPQHFGQSFDPANPVETTSTILVRTSLAKLVGFQRLPEREFNTGEDWRFTTLCIAHGAKIVHLAERTWKWNLHGGNTSGLPNRGDAVS